MEKRLNDIRGMENYFVEEKKKKQSVYKEMLDNQIKVTNQMRK